VIVFFANLSFSDVYKFCTTIHVANRDGTLVAFGKNQIHDDIDPNATRKLILKDLNDFVKKLCRRNLHFSKNGKLEMMEYESAFFTFGMTPFFIAEFQS